MKSHRNEIKWIYSLYFIVTLKIHKECFFIWQIPIISHMIVHFEVVRAIFMQFYFVSW